MNGIAPYVAADSGRSAADVMREISGLCYLGYGPDWRNRGGAIGTVVDSMCQYERLLDDLLVVPNLEFVPFNRLLAEPLASDKIRCAIRHDVDLDIRAALSEGELERDRGISSTYFVLHTAPYYGRFADGRFIRHDAMADVYLTLQGQGHEIALHTDPLYVYQSQGLDGASAVRVEIDWLRSKGLRVTGTTAHNSVSVYGAANFAIFKGRPQSYFANPAECPKEVVHNGRWAPLGVLDERELGLAYEANDVFWQKNAPVGYGAAWGVNRWWWEDEKSVDRLRRPADGQSRFSGLTDYECVLERIAAMEGGKYLVLVVHPCHYGARHAPSGSPTRHLNRRTVIINDALGWETYAPGSVVARSGCLADGKEEFQAINVASDWGMLDLPKPVGHGDEVRVLILGGTNLAGETVAAPGQVSTLLSEGLEAELGRKAHVWKMAFPGMGLTRLFGWYRRVRETIRPHVVVIGLGTDEGRRSLPDAWRYDSGFHPDCPPGDYLHWNGDRVVLIRQQPGARVCRDNPSATPLLTDEMGQDYMVACLKYFADAVTADGAKAILVQDACGEENGGWVSALPISHRRRDYEFGWATVSGMAAAVGLPIVDSYVAMLESSRHPTHWQSVPEWNYYGHRIVAEAIKNKITHILSTEEML